MTRVGITLGCLMVLGTLLTRWAITEPATPPPNARVAPGVAPPIVLPEQLTQRRGEWSPICARTKQPLIDFSPIDHGQSVNRLVLTVHNCSAKVVTLRQPGLELSDDEPLATQGPALKPIRLKPWASATTVLTWNPTATDPNRVIAQFAVRVTDIGEGQLTDQVGPGMSKIHLTQWTT